MHQFRYASVTWIGGEKKQNELFISTQTPIHRSYLPVGWQQYSRFCHVSDLEPFPGASVKLIRWSSLALIRARK